MSFRQTTAFGAPAIALRSEELELVAIPVQGQRLSHLRRQRGREWLWHRGDGGAGGWNECFPTIGASPIPGAPAGTPALPERGELGGLEWLSSVYEDAEGTTLVGTAQGLRLPYEFQRTVTLLRDAPIARLRYRLRNTGEAEFPWIWAPDAWFTVQAGTTLELPGVRQVKLDAVHGRPDLSPGDVVGWPESLGEASDRFVFPDGARWGVRLFGDLGRDGRMALIDPRQGERLEIAVDRSQVPQVRVWITPDGLALGPSIGAPDRLEDAVLGWGTAQRVAPGEERAWEVKLRLP